MSGTKFMYNKWWQRAGDVMTLWDSQKLNKIYELLIEDTSEDDYNSVSFYMKQLFGYCCYVFSEISTLLDGHIRSDVQRNGFFRDFVDTSKKGTYSAISNMHTNKPIVLQKCCKDFLGSHLSAKDKLEMEREAHSLEEMIPLVRSFIHHSVYKAGKKKSGVLKRFGVTSSFLDGLSMRFAPDATSKLSLIDCKEAVAFVTKNDTLCMFESFSKGICSFAPGFEEAHKVIAATFLLEADMKLATLLQSNLEKEEKIAKDAREFAELSKKNKHGGKKSKSGVTLTVAEPPPQFIMNTAKKDIAPRSQNAKKILEANIARALKKQKSVDDGLEDDEFFEHGFDMVNDDVAPLVAVGEVVISEEDFISNETIVENVTFHPSVSPMYGESPSNEAKKFYKENMVHGRRTSVDEEESNEDTDVLCDQEYDNVNGDQNSDDGSDSDYSAGVNHDSIVQKAAEITAFVKEVRKNKPSRTTKRTDRVGSPIKARKIRSRGMDKDLFKTMLVLIGDRPSVEAMKVLQADFDTEKQLKHLKAGFKDFLTAHIQAEAFSEINFERRVVEFITDIHWAMERVEGEVFTVNWPAVLSNIGKDIIEAFKVSNKNILDNLNLKIKSRLDSAGNVRPDSQVLEAAEMEENKKSMQAFQRVYLQKLSNIILSVGFKLVDHWMKVHKMVSDMDSEVPLAKKPRRLAFMEHVHKVSVGEHSCQSMFEDSKSRDLELAEKELPPDQSSILFFVHSLPKTDPYMLALIEVTRHQVKDHVVDWDVDAEMRVLFHKKPLVPRKVKEVASPTGVADSAVLNKVEQNSPIPQTSSGLQLSLQADEPSSPPAVSVDFVNLASALPAVPHISAGPPGTSEFRPSSVDNFIVRKEDSLRKLLKRLLEFVLVGLTESDENLCIEIKNACYLMLDGVNQGLILLIDLLKLCLGYIDENTPESPASRECFELLKCSLFVPYDHGDPQNTIGNGYCLYVSTFQLKERMKSGYVMDVRDMKEFAEPLFEPPNSIEDSSLRDEFQEHLRSISSCLQCEAPNGERVKHLTKLDQVIARHLESPQSGIESELYGHLEWISELNFNVSVFSTVHFKADLEGRWAKLTASSRIPRNQDSTGTANSFAEIGRLFQEPPNFMAWMDPHFFTIHSPSHQDVQASFASLTERLVKRIQDRVKSFNAEAVLRVCLSLIEKEAIDVSAIDIVSAAIETIFSGLREDRRVPSCALVDFFKPSVSIASSTSQDLMTYYQQRATQQADKLLKYASTIKSLRAANKQYRTAEKERLSSMSQPSSADVNSSSSSSSGSGSIFLSDNNQSSPSINRLIHEGGKESPVLTSDDNEFE